MYDPRGAVLAGFLDQVVEATDLWAVSLQAAGALAALDPAAHAATKLRARGGALKALRAAIEAELTVENLAAPPAGP